MTLADALAQFEREAAFEQFDTGRYRAAYSIWGNGPALVFIHGLNDVPRSFVQVMARLKDAFRCIAYTLPTGRDGAFLKSYSLRDYAADLTALLDHLDLPQVELFGSSFGSLIALTALHADPMRFPRGILQGGFARRPLGSHQKWAARIAQFFPGRMKHLPGRIHRLNTIDYPSFKAYPASVWEFLIANSGRTPIRAVALRALLLGRSDLRALLPAIHQPVLLIVGDRDELVPNLFQHELAAGLPNAQRVEFSPCGHYPQYVRPAETAAAVREFLLMKIGDRETQKADTTKKINQQIVQGKE